jgi:hypothetical protein
MSTGTDDKTLVIDNYLRKISIPKGITCLGVEYDDDVLHLDFKMPRYLGETDLSKFSIRVNYLNAQGEPDVYSVKNPIVTSDHIAFTWIVGPTAVAYKGDTKFNVCLKLLDDEGYIDKEYNTTIATLPVLEGLETDESVVSRYTDILEQWKAELFGIGDTEEANMRAVSQEEQEKLVQKGAEVLATIPEEYQTTVKMAEEGIRTKADAIVCSAQGELITVSDSSDDHIRNLRVFGKTTQVTTTGTNLFNPYAQQNNSFGNATVENNGARITVTGTYYVSWPLKLKAGVTYYINFETVGAAANRAIRFEYPDKEITGTVTNPASFTPTKDTVSVYLYAGLGTEGTIIYENVQISEGPSAIPWEPYSGGMASPSPDWPQPLVNVENPTVAVHGKNLFDPSKLLAAGWTENNGVYSGRSSAIHDVYNYSTGIPLIDVFKPNTRYIMSFYCRVEADADKTGVTFTFKYDDGTTTSIYPGSITGKQESFISVSGKTVVGLYASYGSDLKVHLSDVQLEEGYSITEYEPYSGGSIELTRVIHGIPVTSGGNYTDTNGQQWICDEIDFERGVHIQRVGQMTLTNERTYYYNADISGKEFFYTSENNNAKAWETRLYSSHFPAIGGKVGMESNYWMQFSGSGGIRFRHKDLTSLDELAAWLPENPVSLCYVLATPIETPLTAEELEAFKVLKTNYRHTTVLNDAGAHMELSYNADTKTYVDNGIKKTVTDVLEAIENGHY